jgi:hypothetical protein
VTREKTIAIKLFGYTPLELTSWESKKQARGVRIVGHYNPLLAVGGPNSKTPARMSNLSLEKAESANVDKADDLAHEAEEAVHGVTLSMLSDPALRAEMPPFFSRDCLRILFACSAGYFATALYGYDAGLSHQGCRLT